MEDTNRLPASALTIPELIEVMVAKPEFRGLVIWDPTHTPGEQNGEVEKSFSWRSMNCDAHRLCGAILESLPHAAIDGNGAP